MAKLIKIKPTSRSTVGCLYCQSADVEVKELLFQGMHVLVDCSCETCKRDLYHTLPVGHDLLFPIRFEKNGSGSNTGKNAAKWLADPLIDSFFKHPKIEAEIEKKVFLEKESAIILNCLDSCFGHVFTKLWNATLLIETYPDMAVIVLLPKSMEWLVPDGVAEIWSVATPLRKLNLYISNLDKFVKEALTPYRSVYLSPAFVHLDSAKVDVEAFVKVKPFSLSNFSTSPPQITFILRDDRFWHRNSFEFFLFQLCVKFKVLNYFKVFFLRQQNQFFNKIAQTVNRQQRNTLFVATGIGRPGGLSSLIKDLRKEKITDVTEKEWCEIYSKSHVVIGVHGSNMLIPSSLAAGFIELLPRHKIPHITEDLVLQHPSRYSVFLGRHLDLFASAKLVSLHARSMIRDLPFLYKNTEQDYSEAEK